MKKLPDHEEGSGNVFADLGLPNAPELQAKADLAAEISRTIGERGLTQVEAAAVLGIDQPKVSALVRGRLGGFSMERLYRFLNALGKDVEIVVRDRPESKRDRSLNVVMPDRERSAGTSRKAVKRPRNRGTAAR
jgi:predicted XRE-type DNA-binding protein